MISQKAKDFTEVIYKAYGSGTGWLFGISPDKREAVEAIVDVTIEMCKDKIGEIGVMIDNWADMDD